MGWQVWRVRIHLMLQFHPFFPFPFRRFKVLSSKSSILVRAKSNSRVAPLEITYSGVQFSANIRVVQVVTKLEIVSFYRPPFYNLFVREGVKEIISGAGLVSLSRCP